MISKKMINNLGVTRAIAVTILDLFEEMLDAKGIKVPDDDRIGSENEACLYGQTYANLEDSIYELLCDYVDE